MSTEGRKRLLANLEVALALAKQLNQVVSNTFPQAAASYVAPDFSSMTTDEKIALGNKQTLELQSLVQDIELERMETRLATDAQSKQRAADIISKL